MPFVAGAGEDIAGAHRRPGSRCNGPADRRTRCSVPAASTLVNLAVGRRRGVDAAARRQRNRVDLELLGVEEDGALAVGVDAEYLPFVAAADEERAVGRADERP